MVVPFAAGGASDVVARAIAPKLTDKLGQSVVVEEIAPAPAAAWRHAVVRSQAAVTPCCWARARRSRNIQRRRLPPYDAQRDFTPIALIATVPLVLTVVERLPVKSVSELLDHARRNPEAELRPGRGRLVDASGGAAAHLDDRDHDDARAVSRQRAAVADLIAGNVDLGILTMSAVLHAGGGKVRPIAVSTTRRAAALPDLPTINESGVPDYNTGLWTGLMGPANLPPAIVARLHGAVAEALASPDMKEILVRVGAEQTGGTPEQFAAEIRRDLAVWRDLVQKTGIRID